MAVLFTLDQGGGRYWCNLELDIELVFVLVCGHDLNIFSEMFGSQENNHTKDVITRKLF